MNIRAFFRRFNEPQAQPRTFVPPNDSKINPLDLSSLSPVTLWISLCVEMPD